MQKANDLTKRTAYISHLRRAFLLRAHPDRFRSQPDSVRKIQAEAIQAFQERISAPDFTPQKSLDYNGGLNKFHGSTWKQQQFYLEQKNGSLQKFHMHLNKHSDEILKDLADALRSTGMSVMKAPPPLEMSVNPTMNQFFGNKTEFPNFHAAEMNRVHSILKSVAHGSDAQVNPAFDMNSRRGRDMMRFLKNLDRDEVRQRKASRVDATAAALVARQCYKFQSIDGTRLGWSSESLAKCLTSLTKLFDEHHSKFKVKSFYPFRLALSNDEFQDKLDLFGGTIMLNPGSTNLQWLETLMSVSEEAIVELERNRRVLLENQTQVQNALNVKIRKGYSCTSVEYYNFLNDMSVIKAVENEGSESENTAIIPQRIQVVVETVQACRRATVTNVGELRISSGMSLDKVMSSIRSHRGRAREAAEEEGLKRIQSKELASLIQYDLGTTKVSKSRLNVTTDQYLLSLKALLSLPEETKSDLKTRLAGNSLEITGSGRSCHLGDDGSVLIPYDWR